MKFSSSAVLLLPLMAKAQAQVDTGFGVEPPKFGGGFDSGFGVDPVIDPGFGVSPPDFERPDFERPDFERPEIDRPEIDGPDFDPGFGVDPDFDPGFGVDPDFDPGFGVDPEIDPGFGVDPEIDPGFGVDPEIDPGFGVDPEIDPGFGVDPEIDPGFGVDPEIDPGFGVEPEIDPGFGVDPPTNTPTSSDTTDSPTLLVGGGRDEYGCNPSAGFSWCPSLQECVQPFETPCDTIILGDDGSPDGLLPGWTLFDPFGRARIATDSGDCDPTSGEYVQANLDYFQGVNIECDDESSEECQPLIPPNPTYEGNFSDKWLVTVFVLATPGRQCPTEGGPLTNNFGVQFYSKDRDGSRSISSRVVHFGRIADARGVAVDNGMGFGYHASCVKVPLGCQDQSPSFEGWTGISYQNRPSLPDECEGPIDLYIDSIRVSNMCPFDVPDDEDLGDGFCASGEDNRNFRDVCNSDAPTGSPAATVDSTSDVPETTSTETASVPSAAPLSETASVPSDAPDVEDPVFPVVGSSGGGVSFILSKTVAKIAVAGILVAAAW